MFNFFEFCFVFWKDGKRIASRFLFDKKKGNKNITRNTTAKLPDQMTSTTNEQNQQSKTASAPTRKTKEKGNGHHTKKN